MGEDGAEMQASKFSEVCKEFEDWLLISLKVCVHLFFSYQIKKDNANQKFIIINLN